MKTGLQLSVRRFVVVSLALTLTSTSGSKSLGSEIRIAVAPKIGLPKDSPLFTEDTASFYGTNIALLTSSFLRARAETQLRKSVPSSLRVEATRIPNTSIISVVATGADEAIASTFLSALFDQFIRFKREQKDKYYRDAIARVDTALASVAEDYAPRLKVYREQLVIVSLLDVKPDFERIEY